MVCCISSLTVVLVRYQGCWAAGKRYGLGCMVYADGTRFRGRWEDDYWVQSAAHPVYTRVRGRRLARAVAGQQSSFTIQVGSGWYEAIATGN